MFVIEGLLVANLIQREPDLPRLDGGVMDSLSVLFPLTCS